MECGAALSLESESTNMRESDRSQAELGRTGRVRAADARAGSAVHHGQGHGQRVRRRPDWLVLPAGQQPRPRLPARTADVARRQTGAAGLALRPRHHSPFAVPILTKGRSLQAD